MNELFKDIRWKRHAPAILLLVFGCAFMGLAIWQYIDARDRLDFSMQVYNQQKRVNQEAFDAKETLNEYLDPYQTYQNKNVIGDARRLQWVEKLQYLAKVFYAPSVLFTLDGQVRTKQEESAYWQGGIDILRTPMTLDMRLGHEGDFFMLLNALQTEVNGLFSVDECELKLVAAAEDVHYANKEMVALCLLTWYNLSDVTARWAEQEGDK
ncbi:MAG: hypothetical protein H6998_19050 [Hahellaceae bacterium]|jgi:hypothetical protein|nr:hypothetical protein [Hahellaceae bacterium]